MNRILIIGAGQLGSRHLQALNLHPQKLNIQVVDPSAAALETAKARFEATLSEVEHQISYEQEYLPQEAIDIAIIASTAKSRRSIIENLLKQIPVAHLVLEKLLFTQEEDYFAVEELLSLYKTKAWVNCCMRMMPFYQSLKSLFRSEAMHYQVTGSQFGLITNAIHYLDHLAYLTNLNEFKLDLNYLDKEIIPSKRAGYFELTGTLLAHFSNGSIASLHCDKEGSAPVQIEIHNNKHRIISREWEQKVWQTGQDQDWQWKEIEAPIPFQSTLTASLVESLLDSNQCQLTPYTTSMSLHLQLLQPLSIFLKEQGFESAMDYPFT